MKKLLKKIPLDFRVSLFLILLSVILLVVNNKNFIDVLSENKQIIIKTLYLTVLATLISTIIHFSLPANFAENRLKQNKIRHLFFATILGILTPGPVYAIYPIVLVLKKKGIKNPLLVSYLTGQTIIGPARIPFELGFFGLKFFLYRILLSIFMGPLAGLLYIALSKILPDKEITVPPATANQE